MNRKAADRIDTRTLLGCFLRTYLIGTGFNTRGLQNVGLVFALEPGLRKIYPDPTERRDARKRYLKFYNTHFFWTPLLVGIFLSLEDKIARGLFPEDVLKNLKTTTEFTLSAIGDSVFGGTLLVTWSLTASLLVVTGCPGGAALFTGLLFLMLQVFRLGTFIIGFREGLKFLQRLKRWNLINWGARLKGVNAALFGAFLFAIWPEASGGLHWLLGSCSLAVAAFVVWRLHVAREVVVLILLSLYTFFPWLVSFASV